MTSSAILPCGLQRVVASHSANGVNGDASDSLHQSELGGGALEDARLRYKSAVASLRSVLTAVPSHPKAEAYESGTAVGGSESGADQAEIEKLQDQVVILRKKVADKNKHVKLLTDQFRELITDISTWQSPCSL
ncbi:hypothetical protein MKW98_013296 [Papaver atlanticum]|uniref:Mediator of RNA polymerase II transcription subunit 30 n=1 Tax=Papaver atlanticum TaxID=357466 RepID=A0AAD4SG17_9MAGN|nr:hypothetical protein MKW98_013296 [Papaver atlanticum]